MKISAQHIKLLLSFMVLISPALFWQNCGQPMRAYDSSSEVGLGLTSEKIRQKNCASCHNGQASAPEPKDIMDDQSLLAKNWIIAGNAAASIVYQSLFTGMPKDAPKLSQAQIDVIADWINNINLSGANLTITDAPKFDFGAVSVGVKVVHNFTVINTGRRPASNIVYEGLMSPFAMQSTSTCGATLNPGTPCTIEVSFLPTTVSSANDTLNISYNDGISGSTKTLSQDVSGAGTSVPSAYLRFAASSQTDFGIVAVASTQERTITVENIGTGAASKLSVFGLTAPFSRSGGTCGTELAASASCTVVVKVAPTAAGPLASNLDVVYMIGSSDHKITISLKGTASIQSSAPANLLISEANPYNFGSTFVGMGFDRTFTVSNAGNKVATAISAAIPAGAFAFKGNAFPGAGGTCVSSLGIGANCTLVVRFNPTAVGSASANLTLSYNDGVAAKSVVKTLQGTAVAAPLAKLDFLAGADGAFGTVLIGDYGSKTLTVKNTGNEGAESIAISVSNQPAFVRTGGSCATTLNVGDSCTISLRFEPSSQGSGASSLAVSYRGVRDSAPKVLTLSLTGVGALPPAEQVTFAEVGPILQNKCSVCHAAAYGSWGGSASALPVYGQLMAFSYPSQGMPAIIPKDANSRFIKAITTGTAAGHIMGQGSYGSLTPAEVKTITDWIVGGALNSTYPSYFVTLMADRSYVTSVLRSVFNNHATAVSATGTLLSRSDLRGSPCFASNLTYANATSAARLHGILFADDRCDSANTTNTNLNATMNPSPNTVAEATRIAACAQIIANTGALSAALAKSGLGGASAFDAANVTKAYQSFYVDRAPSAAVTSSLINIGQEAQIKLTGLSADQRNVQGWRFIYLALCQSTGWQVH